jgi:hypothetical protein
METEAIIPIDLDDELTYWEIDFSEKIFESRLHGEFIRFFDTDRVDDSIVDHTYASRENTSRFEDEYFF